MSVAVAKYTDGEYLDSVPDWHEGDSYWKAANVVRLLQRNELRIATVSDVGCGAGQILVQLQQHLGDDVTLHGYDISPQAIEICRPKENANLRFFRKSFLRDSDDVYDLLLLLDVFEHVPAYLSFLSTLVDRARSFVFHIPLDMNAMSILLGSRYLIYMRRKYGHLHYFSRETAIATLEDAGFDIVDYFVTWDGDLDAPKGRDRLRHPIKYLSHVIERMAFKLAPTMMASLRPGYNLMLLAKPRA